MNRINRLAVALFEPRIPQNTGNIARTCVAFKIPLVLIGPLGFSLEDRYLKRAGLDYWKYLELYTYNNIDEFIDVIPPNSRLIGSSKKGGRELDSTIFKIGDILLFGREDTGLPEHIRHRCDLITTIPMPGEAKPDGTCGVRSLNLSVATALISYRACSELSLL